MTARLRRARAIRKEQVELRRDSNAIGAAISVVMIRGAAKKNGIKKTLKTLRRISSCIDSDIEAGDAEIARMNSEKRIGHGI